MMVLNCLKTFIVNIRIELLTINKWLCVNKLSLDTDKTKLLVFDNVPLSVRLNLGSNHRIKECKSLKYLGLIVDNLLKFNLHVDYIKKKIRNEYELCIEEGVFCLLNT